MTNDPKPLSASSILLESVRWIVCLPAALLGFMLFSWASEWVIRIAHNYGYTNELENLFSSGLRYAASGYVFVGIAVWVAPRFKALAATALFGLVVLFLVWAYGVRRATYEESSYIWSALFLAGSCVMLIAEWRKRWAWRRSTRAQASIKRGWADTDLRRKAAAEAATAPSKDGQASTSATAPGGQPSGGTTAAKLTPVRKREQEKCRTGLESTDDG